MDRKIMEVIMKKGTKQGIIGAFILIGIGGTFISFNNIDREYLKTQTSIKTKEIMKHFAKNKYVNGFNLKSLNKDTCNRSDISIIEKDFILKIKKNNLCNIENGKYQMIVNGCATEKCTDPVVINVGFKI